MAVENVTGADIFALPEICIANTLSLTTPKDACRLSLVASNFRSAAQFEAVWESGELGSGVNGRRGRMANGATLVTKPGTERKYHARKTTAEHPKGRAADLLALSASRKDGLLLPSGDYHIMYRRTAPQILTFSDEFQVKFLCEKSGFLTGERRVGRNANMLACKVTANCLGQTMPDIGNGILSLAESRFSEAVELLDVCWFENLGARINTKIAISRHQLRSNNLCFHSQTTGHLQVFESQTALEASIRNWRSSRLQPRTCLFWIPTEWVSWPSHMPWFSSQMKPQVGIGRMGYSVGRYTTERVMQRSSMLQREQMGDEQPKKERRYNGWKVKLRRGFPSEMVEKKKDCI
nr:F-box protein PP2-B10-like [Ipomoea batatas]